MKLFIVETDLQEKEFSGFFKNYSEVILLSPLPAIQEKYKKLDVEVISTLDVFSNEDHFYVTQEIFKTLAGLQISPHTNSAFHHLRYYLHLELSYIGYLLRMIQQTVIANDIKEIHFFSTYIQDLSFPKLLDSEQPLLFFTTPWEKSGIKIQVHKIAKKNKLVFFQSNFILEKTLYYLQKINLALIDKKLSLCITSTLFPTFENLLKKLNTPLLLLWYGDNFILGQKVNILKRIALSLFSFLNIILHKMTGTMISLGRKKISPLAIIDLPSLAINSPKLMVKITLKNNDLFLNQFDLSNFLSKKIDDSLQKSVNRLMTMAQGLNLFFKSFTHLQGHFPHTLNSSYLLAEWLKENKHEVVITSHGSHVVPKNEIEKLDFKLHGEGLILGPQTQNQVQSKYASDYLNFYSVQTQQNLTGPLLWGVDLKSPPFVRDALKIPHDAQVILHASTFKSRDAFRIHMYETPEEYVQTILQLVEAIKSLENHYLIIKFRPRSSLSINDLTALLEKHPRVIIESQWAFIQVLKESNLLVSFSSTAIEEALVLNKQVLLFGGRGRMNYLSAPINTFNQSHIAFCNDEKFLEKLLLERSVNGSV
jgi:CDP-glycerol glycerophosphotransferase (TagB/SpsB family)